MVAGRKAAARVAAGGDSAARKNKTAIFATLDKEEPGAKVASEWFKDRTFTGAILFFVVAGLALVFFIGLCLVTWATLPSAGMISELMPSGNALDRLQAYQDLHNAWVQQTTTLGQLVLFGSVIPVISTIVGYVLGSESSRRR